MQKYKRLVEFPPPFFLFWERYFSWNRFLEGGFTFQWGGIWFSVESGDLNFNCVSVCVCVFLTGRVAPLETLALMEEIFFKKSKDEGTVGYKVLPSTKELPDITLQLALKTSMFDEPKSPVLLSCIAKKLFGQQWLFESNTNDIETDDSEELAL